MIITTKANLILDAAGDACVEGSDGEICAAEFVAGDRGVIWSIADTLNGLMALPNLVALILLSGTVFKLTKAYSFSD